MIEQLARSDETVRRHVIENGAVEIRAEWLTCQDAGIRLDFWTADRGNRRMLGVTQLTATTLLAMLERPHSATLMATFPQRRGNLIDPLRSMPMWLQDLRSNSSSA